jgi:hypothetical protein
LRVISQQDLNWRRDKVRELTIKGYTQREIATQLQIDAAMINRDLKFMRQQAKENIQHYIDEYLPAEYQYCLDALNMIVKEMWALKTDDNRELVLSRQLIKDCCAMRIDLLSNATVVDRAVKFVENHVNKSLQTQQNDEVAIHDTAESK